MGYFLRHVRMSASYLEKAESELFSAGILPLPPPPAPPPPTPPPPADPEEDDSLAEECCIWRSCWYIISWSWGKEYYK